MKNVLLNRAFQSTGHFYARHKVQNKPKQI